MGLGRPLLSVWIVGLAAIQDTFAGIRNSLTRRDSLTKHLDSKCGSNTNVVCWIWNSPTSRLEDSCRYKTGTGNSLTKGLDSRALSFEFDNLSDPTTISSCLVKH